MSGTFAKHIVLWAMAATVARVTCATPLDFGAATPYGAGFARDGDTIVCAPVAVSLPGSAKPQKRAGACWTITLDQAEPIPVRFGAEGIVESPCEDIGFCVYVDVTFYDGSHQWGVVSRFDPELSAGWHRREVVLRPKLPIRSLSCYLLASGGGAARFRSPEFATLPQDKRPLLDGEPLPEDVSRSTGFLLRDVAAAGRWGRLDDSASGDCSLSSRRTQRGNAHIIDAVLSGGASGDRAVTLAYFVALPGGMMEWFDSPRKSIPLTSASEEQSFVLNLAAGNGLSAWPFGAVSTDGRGVAIGIDPEFPAVYRVVAVPRRKGLVIAFDIGLTPEKQSAHVRFAVFPFVARDGFRGALESYQALYPEAHRVRAPHQGNWMAFHSISNLPHHEDFGFRFKEGTTETEWDDMHGIYTFHYEEPCTWWMRLGKTGDGAVATTRGACAERAKALADAGDSSAIAWLACAVRNGRGLPYGEIRDTPWCNGIVWSLNCAPGLPGRVTEFGKKWSEQTLRKRYGETPPPFPEGLDGEYLDSANLPVTCAFDFDRAHFGAMSSPLAFTHDDKPRVGVFKGLMVAECVAAVARMVHARGRLVMANTTPVSSSLLAFNLDVMGIETNWKRGGKWMPMPDAEMLYRRAVCGGKPFCFLMNTEFSRFAYEDADRYMQRCLAYGMFPSFFSANAATGHYFSQPALYERDRPLFRKYLPLVVMVAEAGWRPVNRLLSVNAADVFVEQFGDRFATVFNPSPVVRRVRLVPLSGMKMARELVVGEDWSFRDDGLDVEIPPESCRLLSFVQSQSSTTTKERKLQ